MRSAQQIIKRPLLTEKSARLRETGGAASAPAEGDSYSQKVVFEVARDANKVDVRRAVQELFKVSVTHVRTIVVRGTGGSLEPIRMISDPLTFRSHITAG